MTTLERHECLASLVREWEQMPEGDPARRERWFGEVAVLLGDMPHAETRKMWIAEFSRAIQRKHTGLPESICTYIVQSRVEAAQKGGGMYRQNVRRPVASSGTAEELLGVEDVTLNDFIPDECARYDRLVLIGALLLGLLVVCLAFWPALLGWMTEFRYGVVVGMVSAAVLIVGALAIGVCLGAGRLEKSR